MFANPAWTVDVTRVLTRRELASVLADARKQARRGVVKRFGKRAGAKPRNSGADPAHLTGEAQ